MSKKSDQPALPIAYKGVDLSKVKHEHLRAVLKEAGVKTSKSSTPEQLVDLAQTLWHDVPDDDMAICDEEGGCGGESPAGLPVCGFCGRMDEGADAAAPTEPPPPPATTALAKAPVDDLVPSSQVQTERDLDDAVEEEHRLSSTMAGGQWEWANHVYEKLYKSRLWQLRTEEGKPKWKTWETFCLHELGKNPSAVLGAMNLTVAFTAAQWKEIGREKLGLILSAPKEHQARLFEAAKTTGKRDLAADVRQVKKEEGYRKPTIEGGDAPGKRGPKAGTVAKVTKPTGAAAHQKNKRPRDEKITVAAMLGQKTLKAFKKPASLKNFDPDKASRAKRIADVPWAQMEMANGVVMDITLTENAVGELQFVVKIKRDEG